MDPDIQAAEEAIDKLAAEPKQMELYYLREKFVLDQASSAYYNQKKGEKIGEARGIEKGREEERNLLKSILAMLRTKTPDAEIQKQLNLTSEELNQYKNDYSDFFH